MKGPANRSGRNVIYLLLDTVYAKQLGFWGRRPSPTPFIDDILSRSLVFTNQYAVGCPTQFAMPGIFTSTLPLDHGGYEYGIRDRSPSLPELFKAGGYSTSAFVSGWGVARLFGYDRGFDDYFSLFDFSLHLYNLERIYASYYRRLVADGRLSLDEAARLFSPFVGELLSDLGRYCGEKLGESGAGNVIPSPYIHRWNFKGLVGALEAESGAYSSDPAAYTLEILRFENRLADRVLRHSGSGGFWLGAYSILKGKTAGVPVYKVPAGRPFLVLRSLLGGEAGLSPGLISLLGLQQTRVASAAYVVRNFLNWVSQRGREPFFSFIHLMDAHDWNFRSYDIPTDRQTAARELKEAVGYLGEVRKEGAGYSGNIRYDLSLRYLDLQVSRLFSVLRDKGLLSNSIVVIGSDHGSRAGGPGGKEGLDLESFEDPLYHCPLALYDEGEPAARVDGLCSAIDIAPTILDYMGMGIPAAFRGRSLIKEGSGGGDDREVIMEHLGRGPCDPVHKPVRLSLMNSEFRIVYEQNLVQEKKGRVVFTGRRADGPGMESEHYSEAEFPGGVSGLVRAAERRIAEIRETLGIGGDS